MAGSSIVISSRKTISFSQRDRIARPSARLAALRVALRTMQNEPKAASSYLHRALAAASGAVGGSLQPRCPLIIALAAASLLPLSRPPEAPQLQCCPGGYCWIFSAPSMIRKSRTAPSPSIFTASAY